MGDPISRLPLGDIPSSEDEMAIIQSVSPQQAPSSSAPVYGESRAETVENFANQRDVDSVRTTNSTLGHKCPSITMREELTNIAILSVLYVILSSNWFWGLIVKMVPRIDTWYYRVTVTTTLFIMLTFLLTNLKFIKK